MQRNDQLDGLRGYAASAVIIFHCFGPAVFTVPPLLDARSLVDVFSKLAIATFNGITAVSIFFVMSGAVLMHSLLQRESAAEGIVNFPIERVLRIFPALIVWVLVTAAFFYLIGTPPTAEGILQNVVLYDFPVLGLSSTLNAEILATPVILAAFLLLRYRGLGWMLAFCLAVLIAARHFYPHAFAVVFRLYAYPLVLGILVPTRIGRRVAELLPSWALLLVIPAMLLAAHVIDNFMTTTRTLQETFAALFVAKLFYGGGGPVGAWLSRPHAVFLGRISYSLYLANIPFVIAGERLRDYLSNYPISSALLVGTLAVLATVPFAWASFLWIERPFIRFGRSLSRRDKAMINPSHDAQALLPD